MPGKDSKKEGVSNVNPSPQRERSDGLQVNVTQEGLNIFDINKALSAMSTFHRLNRTVNQMFGIEAVWFRAVPQERSTDVIFKEYTLSNVGDVPLCFKVLVPGGNFPDNNYQYDLMGLEYQVPLEIQIDKGYWEDEVGFGTAPQRKDIVYLPLPNKLYQVESSFLKRGFLEQETTWVVNLAKYQPEASRREAEDLKETIDKYTVSEEELLGEQQQKEIEKLTNDKQMSQLSSTSEDKYKRIDPDLEIISSNIDIYGIIAAQSFYDLETSNSLTAITYNTGDIINESDDRAITAWIFNKEKDLKEYDVELEKIINPTTQANYTVTVNTSHKKAFEEGDTFVIYRAGVFNFYATVINVSSTYGEYYCEIDEDVEDYLNSLKSTWVNNKYKMQIRNPLVIIDGKNDTNTGFVVSVIANQFIKIIYGQQTHVVCMDSKLTDEKWYGFVANIGNTWGQYNVYIWEKDTNDRDKKLQIKYYDTINFEPEQTSVNEYKIDKSYSYITNIRLFKTTIKEENQITELLSFFTKDADQAIILDNCDPKMLAPYISKQR